MDRTTESILLGLLYHHSLTLYTALMMQHMQYKTHDTQPLVAIMMPYRMSGNTCLETVLCHTVCLHRQEAAYIPRRTPFILQALACGCQIVEGVVAICYKIDKRLIQVDGLLI